LIIIFNLKEEDMHMLNK